MRTLRTALTLTLIAAAGAVGTADGLPAPGQAGPRGAAIQTQPAAAPRAPQRRNRRTPVEVLQFETSAWPIGGEIPEKHTQAGPEVSPALTWSGAPDGTESYVLLVRDMSAAIGDGTGAVLHWLVWNIPGTAQGLPEGVPQADELPDGTRQISQSGPYYRGPGASAAEPAHHYVFELFALDTALDVPSVGAQPDETREAVMAAMAGHVLGTGALVGHFKRH